MDLRKFQQSESSTSASLAELVKTIQDKYGEEQKRIRSLEFQGWTSLQKDSLAQLLIPDDIRYT